MVDQVNSVASLPGCDHFYILYSPFADLVKYIFDSNPLNSWSIKAKAHLYRAPKVPMSAQEVEINGCNLN